MAERDDAIVALLEERPYATTELAEILELSSGMHEVLVALAGRGRIARAASGRWTLPAPTSGLSLSSETPKPAAVTVSRSAACTSAAAAQSDQPTVPEHASRSVSSPPRAAHRHPHERPTVIKLKKDRPASWWVGLSREELSAAVHGREDSMRESPENAKVPIRILQ